MKFIPFTFLLLALTVGPALAQEPVLQPGQSFVLRIAGVPQGDQTSISQGYTISEGGTVKLLYLSELKAAGLRPTQLSRSLEAAYRAAQIYTKPNITITLGDAPGGQRYVSVLGEVKAPRQVLYSPGLTLLGVVAQCGGWSDFGNPKKVKLTRAGKVSYHDLSKTTNSDNVTIQPNDIIHIPVRRGIGIFDR